MNWFFRLLGVERAREMKEGVKDAQRRLDEAHAQDREIHRLTEQLRRMREVNQFALRIGAALRGHR
jgi:hypothetical protein